MTDASITSKEEVAQKLRTLYDDLFINGEEITEEYAIALMDAVRLLNSAHETKTDWGKTAANLAIEIQRLRAALEFYASPESWQGTTNDAHDDRGAAAREALETAAVRPELEATEKRCAYCGAADNGTCAYPSENKPGCLLPANRERVRAALASLDLKGKP